MGRQTCSIHICIAWVPAEVHARMCARHQHSPKPLKASLQLYATSSIDAMNPSGMQNSATNAELCAGAQNQSGTGCTASAWQDQDYYMRDKTVPKVNLAFASTLLAGLLITWIIYWRRVVIACRTGKRWCVLGWGSGWVREGGVGINA